MRLRTTNLMRRIAPWGVLLCLLLLFGGHPAHAQTASGTGTRVGVTRKIPVHFTATAKPDDPRPGEAVVVTVKAIVDPGWHLYASASAAPNSPATPTDLSAVSNWQPLGATIDDDPPTRKLDPAFHAEVAYHENTASFSRAFRAGSGGDALAVTVHYEVCDAHVCLPPTDVPVPLQTTPGSGAVRPEYKDAPPALTVSAAPASAPTPGSPIEAGSMASGPWFFLAAAGAGLLALVTPCVFPLIPITLASFAKQANGDRRLLTRLAVSYALGVAALYVAFGGAVSALAGAAGANRLAANPWVNLFAFAVFVVFALSFFEAVMIEVPSALTGAVQTKARSRSGWVSLVLLGVVFVLASFTCTAPFVGTLLVAAAGGERLRPLLGMAVFALAFTSPFLLFAAFPQSLTRLPKSGAWLARVKATLGFVELAAALKFLSNADLVWQWKLLTEPVLLAAWALLFAAASLYLLGLLRFGTIAQTETGQEKVSVARGAWAGLFAGAALYCFWGLSGRPLHPIVRTFLPPAGYGLATASTATSASGGDSAVIDGMTYIFDYDAGLNLAKQQNKLLFVDFTGYTCANCRWNEQNVFPDAAVHSALDKFVRVQLYTDGPNGPKYQDLEAKQFGDIAQPLYGIVDPATGKVLAKTAGVQTPGGFAAFLQDALKQAPASAGASDVAATGASETRSWQPYSEEALAAAKAAGKPVIIDFTAAWCINCKEIEKDVFEEPTVAARLGRDWVTLRADLTRWADPASVGLQKKYDFAALPTIVLLDPQGNEIKAQRITGRLSVADFNKKLDAVKP